MRVTPEGWEEYSKIGTQVENTPFIAFKVPLKPSICSRIVEPDNRFTLDDIIDGDYQIGLIIDLTFTSRYYDANYLKTKNVLYEKIFLRGHGKLPHPKDIRHFIKIVKKFSSKSDKLIGVHCTHGVNRTGFLICKYMIEELSYEPKDAIEAFEKARGHKFDREVYIQNLLKGKGFYDERNCDRESVSCKKNFANQTERRKPYSDCPRRHRNGYGHPSRALLPEPRFLNFAVQQSATGNPYYRCNQNYATNQRFGGYRGYTQHYQNTHYFQPRMNNFSGYPCDTSNHRDYHAYGSQNSRRSVNGYNTHIRFE
ncbi:hypothetical protein B4U80_03056 [Leptotrombidium deliense]|uniref:Tyrosine specific protein phosphatases domain-containing protein n=1 Tax=Leptotrombidium deliense TaxID=299467 RepID=A0A443SUP1_9ACAR|nr:hypothetical protein B4U80_03056 [Leptotrombidium deliense]